MESAALSGLHLQTPYVYKWINELQARNSSQLLDDRNHSSLPSPTSGTTGSGFSSSSEEAIPSPVNAPSMASLQAHEVFGQHSRSTIDSEGTRNGLTGNHTNSHYEGIGSYVHKAFKLKKICDVSFQVDNVLIPVHKLVLASQSILFKEVFEDEEFSSDPVTPKVIRVKNVSVESMEKFTDFLYTGHIVLKYQHIQDLLKLAETFCVEKLTKLCHAGIENLESAQLLKLLSIMRGGRNIQMSQRIMQIISKDFMEWVGSEAFLGLDIDTVCMILSDDSLNIQSEMDVFMAGVNYINHLGAEEKEKYLERIMGCIRFPLLTKEQLFSCFQICPILRQNHQVVMDITLANWIQTSLSLGEEDPLDLEVPKPRSHNNSVTSVASYISNHRSSEQVNEQEDPDVEVEISRMSEDMARDFNTHAYLRSASSSTISNLPLIEQYSNSKLARDCSMMGDSGETQRIQKEMLAKEKWSSSVKGEMQSKQGHDRRILQSLDIGMGVRCGLVHKEKKKDPNKSTRKKKKRDVEKGDRVPTNQDGKFLDENEKIRKKAMVWGGTKWFLIGGPGHDGGPSKKVMAYSYETKQWTPLAPMNVARMDHTLCLLDGLIYAIGGIGDKGRVLTRVECYNPKTNCWFYVKSLPEPRAGASATTENGRIYLSGGYGALIRGQVSDFMDSVEIYNVDANKWTPGF